MTARHRRPDGPRPSPRRLPPGVLTLLCVAPVLRTLAAITGRGGLSVVAVNTARVALLIAGLTLALMTSQTADAADHPQPRS